MSETKAYFRIGNSPEYVTYVDTYDVGKVVADIRARHSVEADVEITVRIPSTMEDEPTSVQEYMLTDVELANVQQAITDHGETAGLLAVWEAILGAPLADKEDSLNPSEYAIPYEQWETIAGYMIGDSRTKHPTYEGIPAFSMVNQGPSSYTPATDPQDGESM